MKFFTELFAKVRKNRRFFKNFPVSTNVIAISGKFAAFRMIKRRKPFGRIIVAGNVKDISRKGGVHNAVFNFAAVVFRPAGKEF